MTAMAQASAGETPSQALLAWVREALHALAAPGSRWASALTWDGRAVGELCFEECFLQGQQALEGVASAPPARPLGAAPARAWRALRTRVAERLAPLRALPPAPADGVFHAVEPTHLTQQLPVAAALAGRARVRFVTPRASVVSKLAARGVGAVLVQAAWSDVRAAGQVGARAAEALRQAPGIALPPPPRGDAATLLVRMREVLTAVLPAAYQAARAAELILAELAPRLVVVGNDLTVAGRALALAARGAGVPSACIMHGTVLDAVHGEHVASRLLVYGDAHRRHLVQRQGIEAARVVVTGAPYLDSLTTQKGHPDARITRGLGLRPGQPFVLMAISNPANLVSMQQHERTIRAVMRLSARLGGSAGTPVVARLHRGDSPAHYERLAAEVPGQRLRVVRNDDPRWPGSILDWLQGAAVLLTGASTVGLEAMLLDVPVVTMDFTGDYADVDFIRAGATAHVTDDAALERAVTALLGDPAAAAAVRARAASFLGDYFHLLDRGAAARCAGALTALLEAPCAG